MAKTSKKVAAEAPKKNTKKSATTKTKAVVSKKVSSAAMMTNNDGAVAAAPNPKKIVQKNTNSSKKKKIVLPFYVALQCSKWPTARKIVVLPDKRKTTIRGLKELIAEDYGIPVTDQHLFFQGNKLNDEYDLYECNISETNVIDIMVQGEEEGGDLWKKDECTGNVEPEKTEGSPEREEENLDPEIREFLENNPEPEDNFYCEHCKDDPEKKCKECSCQVCHKKRSADVENTDSIVCDECELSYHYDCAGLDAIPEGDFYCPECKNDPDEINNRDGSKKKLRQRKDTTTDRANKGRVHAKPPHELRTHSGPIPGIEVGQTYYDRMTAYASGVHANHMDGIVGDPNFGAYSICSSGGYDDDQDMGDILNYTGSGGRDLSGNKRTNKESFSQSLDGRSGRSNKALALSCAVPFSMKGGDAKDEWKQGKPVRVLRGYAKCPSRATQFDPPEGYRYDGVYKVVKYWPETGKHGTVVWKYQLRRDDPAPAPWTEEGKKRVEELGLRMKYPPMGELVVKMMEDDYIDAKGRRTKRSIPDDYFYKAQQQAAKKPKLAAAYEVPESLMKKIKADTQNQRTWTKCLEHCEQGKVAFGQEVMEAFECVIGACPASVTKIDKVSLSHTDDEGTLCEKIYCMSCAKKAFEGTKKCPFCRVDVTENKLDLAKFRNQRLVEALEELKTLMAH